MAGLGAGLGLAWAAGGCFTPVAERCPGCAELAVGRPPTVPAGTRTAFLLVPGILGYGWEWNGAQIALAHFPDSATLVYSWEPWDSQIAAGARLARHIEYLRRRLPPSVRELVVVGHSAAGLLAVDAASRLSPVAPWQARVRVITVGAPLAGMGRNLWGGQDMLHTPMGLALGSQITGWREPSPGVKLEIYATGPDDPVMKRIFSHDPGDRRVLPRRAVVRTLPPSVGHNRALTWVFEQLLDRELATLAARREPYPTASR